MKSAAKLILIGMICGVASLASAESTNTGSLTLDKAYESALIHMETVAIAESEWRGAEARFKKAVGPVLPEISATGGHTAKDSSEAGKSPKENYDAGVNVSWVIFNGFKTIRDSKARRAESDAYLFDTVRAKELLYEDVAGIFYQVLALEHETALLAEKEKAIRQRIDELERRIKLGRSRRAESLAVQTQLSDTQVTIEQTKTSLKAAWELFAFLTGKDAGSVKLMDAVPMPDEKEIQDVLSKKKERADISAAGKRAESAQLDAKAASSDRGLKISTDGNWHVVKDDETGDWDLSLKVSLPLLDGGIKRAEVEVKNEAARTQELKLAQLKRSVDKDVKSAVIRFTGLLEQWTSIRKAVAIAKENYDTQTKDANMGRASNLDVLTALVQFHDFKMRESSMEMQLRAAIVQLQVAAGLEKK